SFAPGSISAGGTTALTFTISNPNASTALTGVAFSDPFPAGLVVATPNGLSGSCGGGTITATAGSGSVSLSGATLAAAGSCTFSINVTSTTVGVLTNTTAAVTSTNGGTGNTASATLVVATATFPPRIAKSFAPASIPLGGTSSLTFTIINPNPVLVLSGVQFSDNLPAGVTAAATSVAQCGGTLTSTTTTITLAGASIAAGGSCTFSITVTGATAGDKTNTTTAVTPTNPGPPHTPPPTPPPGTALPPPPIAKSFVPSSILVGATSSLTFPITNPNASTALTGVAFGDTFPAGLQVATPNGLTGSCGGGTITATAGSGSVSLSGA